MHAHASQLEELNYQWSSFSMFICIHVEKNNLVMQLLGIVEATCRQEQVDKMHGQSVCAYLMHSLQAQGCYNKTSENDGKLLTLAHEGIGL